MRLERYAENGELSEIDGKILALPDAALKEFIEVLECHLYDRTWCRDNGVDYVHPFGETFGMAKKRTYESLIERKI